jgi:PTH2 family peptidyl-tRNA hydrolase
MSPGKLGVQTAHASVGSVLCALSKSPDMSLVDCPEVLDWFNEGGAKIVLEVADEDALVKLHKKATAANLPCHLVTDFGLTEIPAGSITVLGIGPAPIDSFKHITGRLSLYKENTNGNNKNVEGK